MEYNHFVPHRKSKNRYHRSEPFWSSFSDEELLDLRFCDLDLRLEETALAPRIQELYQELETHGLSLQIGRAHV